MKLVAALGVIAFFSLTALAIVSHDSPSLTVSRAAQAMDASPNPVDEGANFVISGRGLIKRHVYTLVFTLDDGTVVRDPVSVTTNSGGAFSWTGNTDQGFVLPPSDGTDWGILISLVDDGASIASVTQ